MRFRYDYLPVHLIGEILTKRWIDNLIPFLVLIAVVTTLGTIIPDFFTIGSLSRHYSAIRGVRYNSHCHDGCHGLRRH